MARKVVLEAKLDSAATETLRDTLMTSQGDDIVLDGSAVEQLGGLCVEFLMSARHLWAAAGRSVTLTTPSEQMIDDLGRFGLSETDFQGSPA